MRYSIIGSGSVGVALASQFARSGIAVGMANSRGRDSVVSIVREYGETVLPLTLEEAVTADVVILAVPFWSHLDVAKAAALWHGKIVIDATNAYGVQLPDLGKSLRRALLEKPSRAPVS